MLLVKYIIIFVFLNKWQGVPYKYCNMIPNTIATSLSNCLDSIFQTIWEYLKLFTESEITRKADHSKSD